MIEGKRLLQTEPLPEKQLQYDLVVHAVQSIGPVVPAHTLRCTTPTRMAYPPPPTAPHRAPASGKVLKNCSSIGMVKLRQALQVSDKSGTGLLQPCDLEQGLRGAGVALSDSDTSKVRRAAAEGGGRLRGPATAAVQTIKLCLLRPYSTRRYPVSLATGVLFWYHRRLFFKVASNMYRACVGSWVLPRDVNGMCLRLRLRLCLRLRLRRLRLRP